MSKVTTLTQTISTRCKKNSINRSSGVYKRSYISVALHVIYFYFRPQTTIKAKERVCISSKKREIHTQNTWDLRHVIYVYFRKQTTIYAVKDVSYWRGSYRTCHTVNFSHLTTQQCLRTTFAFARVCPIRLVAKRVAMSTQFRHNMPKLL